MLKCGSCLAPVPIGAPACQKCGVAVSGAGPALMRAVQRFSELRYEESAKEFERALRFDATEFTVRRAHAHARYHAGQVDAAMEIYRELLEKSPTDPEIAFNLGRIFIARNRLDLARSIFEKLVEAPLEFVPGHFYLGLLFKDALQFSADSYHYLALVCWNQKDTTLAEEHFTRALQINPAHAPACRYLGNLHFQAADYPAAKKRYRRYLELCDLEGPKADDYIDVCYKLGVSHVELGELDEATDCFQRTLKDRPGHPGAIYHLNQIYQGRGLYDPGEFAASPIAPASEGASTIFGLTRPKADFRDLADMATSNGGRPIVGKSVAMQRVVRSARLAAASDATVLITGENGTGKELIARAIHSNSKQAEAVFSPVHCAAIPEQLLESELFGHEKGAFTGATQRKIGRFEAASGGTIFLDEIGELTPNMQVKLLRFLQERNFTRVGGNYTVSVDVRIIAATNRVLEDMLRKGTFREDLYFRLNVLPIHLPAVRDRPEDIPLLVSYFMQTYGKGALKYGALVDEEAMKAMLEYEWPGNVRELENLIERAIVMGSSVGTILQGVLQARQLRDHPTAMAGARAGAGALHGAGPGFHPFVEIRGPGEDTPPPPTWEPISLMDVERKHILQTLAFTAGNRAQAARLLGINPATLWRKMKAYQIDTD